METQPIWNDLFSIPIGTVVAWIVVIGTIITALCTGTIKLYRIFEEYKKVKDKNEKQEELIEGHERILEGINAALSEIKESLEEQKEVNLKQIRHTIVHTCEAALERGEISINKLQSLEEMYAEYVDVFHGNGYVKILVTKVRELRVVGKTDEK